MVQYVKTSILKKVIDRKLFKSIPLIILSSVSCQSMSIKTKIINKYDVDYTSPSPKEGGFGYIVFIAVTIIAINCTLPLAAFGIVFGKFLSTLGDETTGTSLANGILNTVMCFTGLSTNVLLNRWSCRNVALLGALASAIGSFGLIFVQDLISFIIFFGVFLGFGYGLLLPASLTALTNHFNKNLSFILSLSQALMVGCTILVPPLASIAMDVCGYRGTLLWISGITVMNIPSSVALSRINWSYRPMSIKSNSEENNDIASVGNNQNSVKSKSSDDLSRDFRNPEGPLLRKHNSLRDIPVAVSKEFKVLHLADRTVSVASVNGNFRQAKEGKEENQGRRLSSSALGFSLLKNAKYLNVSIGLSLSYTSDICFISIIPIILSDTGFSSSDIALTMSIFFGSDLVSRVLLSVVSALHTPNSRYLVLGGSLLSAIFRIGFVYYNSFLWKTITLAALGFLRCFIQTPLPLVISEEYPTQFATAYSLYMVVCGVVTLVFGPLMGVIKTMTNSDVMVCHLLTSCYLICVISWLCEAMFCGSKVAKNDKEECSCDIV